MEVKPKQWAENALTFFEGHTCYFQHSRASHHNHTLTHIHIYTVVLQFEQLWIFLVGVVLFSQTEFMVSFQPNASAAEAIN